MGVFLSWGGGGGGGGGNNNFEGSGSVDVCFLVNDSLISVFL